MKSAMNEVTKRKSLDVRTLKQFKNGFEYIENLIQHYLELPEVLAKSEAPNAQAASDLSGTDSAIESFVPAVVLNNIDNMFREEAESKGLEFRLVISSLPIKTNPLALMRILANLTANAIKYTEHGKVLVGCRRRKKGLALQVLDTGPGLSKAEQDNLFKAWERSTEAKGEGYGLGLAIVETLVHENNLMLN